MSVTIADIEEARRVIVGQVLRTPMLPAPRPAARRASAAWIQGEMDA